MAKDLQDLDISACDREPIHIPGSIQPHGAMLVVDAATGLVTFASANIADYIGGTAADVESLRGGDLTNLTSADNLTQAASATTGAAYNQLQGLQSQNQSVSLALTSRLTSVQNVNMAQALTDLKTAESSYQAALYATSQTDRQSLVSFLS